MCSYFWLLGAVLDVRYGSLPDADSTQGQLCFASHYALCFTLTELREVILTKNTVSLFCIASLLNGPIALVHSPAALYMNCSI